MAAIDNSELVADFIDEDADGDTFWYTELYDRSLKGSSRFKLLRTFEHNSKAHFLERLPTIKTLCDQTGTRAYTRLAPRSRKKVAHELVAHLFKTVVMDKVYGQSGRAYASVCGKHPIHDRKLWLFDCDNSDGNGDPEAALLAQRLEGLLRERAAFVGKVPTKNGLHLVCKPHHVSYSHVGVELHKDNPTNLYIPDGAR
jgi:hypothetical protein